MSKLTLAEFIYFGASWIYLFIYKKEDIQFWYNFWFLKEVCRVASSLNVCYCFLTNPKIFYIRANYKYVFFLIFISNSTVTKLSRSIHVTPFSPKTKSTDIIDHLNLFEHIKPLTNDFNVSKLMKQKPGKLPLTFVSFKIDVPRQYFYEVANRKICKPEINVTGFVPSWSAVNKETLAKNSPLKE